MRFKRTRKWEGPWVIEQRDGFDLPNFVHLPLKGSDVYELRTSCGLDLKMGEVSIFAPYHLHAPKCPQCEPWIDWIECPQCKGWGKMIKETFKVGQHEYQVFGRKCKHCKGLGHIPKRISR